MRNNLTQLVTCPTCGGYGFSAMSRERCTSCAGTGNVPDWFGWQQEETLALIAKNKAAAPAGGGEKKS